ncbi:DUF3052 family protein [Hyphococcus luteus]|uniref:DUF3052 domain-containing protein n=1 Tax=Hyphococcus luteus TaxID=2058213 RepID=A0A2S7K9H4_9PROT|nr:DUF3052 family protein [Marinicaulis flavus]PQA89174.1 DUF3052 domain-containing protein [Marinicaulis flavus]
MTTAGYSGTPLLKKLGVKDGQAALLVAIPETVKELSGFKNWGRVKAVKTPRGISGGPYDYIHFFTASETALNAALPALKKALAQSGLIWVSWPKKASGVPSTVTENTVRALALKTGLVDIKVCAIDETWSGLKLVIPVKNRKK